MKTTSLMLLGPENSTAKPTLQVQQGPGGNAPKGGTQLGQIDVCLVLWSL